MDDQMIRNLLSHTYQEFNNRNIPAVLSGMHPEVSWPNGMEGGYVYGHAGIQDYWTRQWTMVNPHVTPVSFKKESDGRTLVKVHQLVKDLDGNILMDRMVEHVYKFRDGLIISMEIREYAH